MLSRLLCFGFVLLTFALPVRAALQVGTDRLDQPLTVPWHVQSWGSTANRSDIVRGSYLLF